MENDKKEVKVEIPYRETVSRLFIFRFLWVYILMFPMFPLAIWIGITSFLQFWYMLILGKRHEALWNYNVKFFQWMMKWMGYLKSLTDKRPAFWY